MSMLPAILVVLMIAAAVIYAAARIATAPARRRANDRIVVGHIAAIARQGLPLAKGLALAAESERGPAGLALKRMSDALAAGMSLTDALAHGYPKCPGLAFSLIEAGQRSGQMQAALDQADGLLLQTEQRRRWLDSSALLYALVVITWTLTVAAGIMIVVVPKFQEIVQDYGTRLPPLLAYLVAHGDAMVALLLVTMGLLLMVIMLGAYYGLSRRGRQEPSVLWRISDWLHWRAPGLRAFALGDGLSAALRTTRFAVRAGMPLDAAMRLAAGLDLNVHLKARISRFAEALAAGRNVRDAARECELGEVAGIALSAGQRGGDLDAGLRYAADYYDALVSRWWLAVRSVSWPICTIALAALVGTFVYSLFHCLVVLIDSVTLGS